MKRTGKTRRSFSEALYAKLRSSIFGAVLTSYRDREKTLFSRSRAGGGAISSAMHSASTKIASSGTVSVLSRLASFFLSLRLKVYGAFFISFGIYTAIFYFANNFILTSDRRAVDMISGAVVALSAIPLASSDDTLSSALTSSRFGKALSRLTGIRLERMQVDEVRGKSNFGFIAGIAAGIISYFTSPLAVLFVIASVVVIWIISSSPEFGVIFTAFTASFVGEKIIAVLLGATLFSLILKVIRGKRYLTFETLDAAVLGIFLVLIFASIAPFDKASGGISLRMALYITVYFLCVNLMKSREWCDRATRSFVKGTALASAIIACVSGASIFFPGVGETVSPIFAGSLLGERIAGLDPASFNMLLTAAIPPAIAHFICPPEGARRGGVAVMLVFMAFPLIEYRSGFAICAVLCAVMLLLVIYSSKFIYLPIALAVLGGGAYFAFPNAAHKVLSVLGAGFDSFAEMRSPAWGGAMGVLSRSFLGGVGFGPDAFRAATGSLSASTVQPTHAYNTYLQFWIEGGVLGFVLLIAFAWLIITAFFKTADSTDLAKRSGAFKGAYPAKGAMPFAEEFALTRRVGAAGPFCSVVGLLIYGMADHIWSDPRVFFVFWLAAGLAASCVRVVRHEISDFDVSCGMSDSARSAQLDIGDE